MEVDTDVLLVQEHRIAGLGLPMGRSCSERQWAQRRHNNAGKDASPDHAGRTEGQGYHCKDRLHALERLHVASVYKAHEADPGHEEGTRTIHIRPVASIACRGCACSLDYRRRLKHGPRASRPALGPGPAQLLDLGTAIQRQGRSMRTPTWGAEAVVVASADRVGVQARLQAVETNALGERMEQPTVYHKKPSTKGKTSVATGAKSGPQCLVRAVRTPSLRGGLELSWSSPTSSTMIRPIHCRCMCGTHKRCHVLRRSARRPPRPVGWLRPSEGARPSAVGAESESGWSAALPRVAYNWARSEMWNASPASRMNRRMAGHQASFCTAVCLSSCGRRGARISAAFRAVAAAARIACLARPRASAVEIMSYGIESRRHETSRLYVLDLVIHGGMGLCAAGGGGRSRKVVSTRM